MGLRHLLLALLVSAAVPARADLRQQVRSYAKERGYPVREVQAGPANRRVTRLMVPVLPADHAALKTLLSEGHGGIHMNILGQARDPRVHVSVGIEEGSLYAYGKDV